MGLFPVEEVDRAFWAFHDALNLAARSTDWTALEGVLTPDVTVNESVLGRLGKFEGVVREVSRVMLQSGDEPWVRMNRFPVEDYSIDHRDWVWSLWWARFTNPGDGSVHQSRVFMLLKYKGDGRFSYIETVHNPIKARQAMESWKAAKAAWDEKAEEYLAVLGAREAEAREMAPLKLDR
jgi:hypothetical protein